MSAIPIEYQKPEGLRTLANYLRSQNGVKSRSAIEHEKRVEYFKGKRLIECILEAKKWPKSIPKITDKGIARLVAGEMVQACYFHRSEKVEDKKGYFQISKVNVFEESGYYTWMYAGNMLWSNIASGGVVLAILGFTLLPLWPDILKQVAWYIAVTILILMLGFCILRTVIFLAFWLLGYDFWIFPRLFDESLSVQDSFKPTYSFESSAKGQLYYRLGLLAGLVAFIYWACTQPTEFDGFLQAQKDFIDDLYSGNLIADVSFDAREKTERAMKGRVPNLEDLLKEMEMDAIEESKSKSEKVDNEGNETSSSSSSSIDQEEESTEEKEVD